IRPKLLVDVPVVLLRPDLPVSLGAPTVNVGALVEDQVLAIHRDLAQPVAHADPVRHRSRLPWHGGADVETEGAVHGALLDRGAAQDAVLGVDPRPLHPVALLAGGPGRDPELRTRSEEHTSELQSPYDLVC